MEAVLEISEDVLVERELNLLMDVTLRMEHELSIVVQSEQ